MLQVSHPVFVREDRFQVRKSHVQEYLKSRAVAVERNTHLMLIP